MKFQLARKYLAVINFDFYNLGMISPKSRTQVYYRDQSAKPEYKQSKLSKVDIFNI
jgi:hypothetical protein